MQEGLFLLLIAVMAFLYASVGHGGASGYLAMMALFGVAPSLMKSSALVLNVFVSILSFVQFYRAGFFRWQLFWPFAVASVPFAYWGAQQPITDSLYKQLLSVALLIAIARMLFQPNDSAPNKPAYLPLSLVVGAIIGFLSGMLGIGGGIILSPVILLLGWAKVKEAAAVSALFIFVNSISALSSLFRTGFVPSPQLLSWLSAALVGGFWGAYQGGFKFNIPTLRYVLAGVLVIACVKLYFT
ncbi:MAG: sulfite exporter TauE/SafE family protein [Cytophagia bacterium]|nr:MAG: sulfite exporter TauE/SafE family protein [Runella sp.]TAG20742.1 MAG: sulfite exporter TauE/SafE family protein [Cytophagales bacterium]TAG39884.1 MAG: sulfite exporter TauE/SafE family protein [Cytophagia bacterium]TAG50758.1 MAG: sulfite exporter TauE/SafE family protein [Runella slithyformis]TAG72413.1 MAG: sulfite exporter TauE/SafE family protein [Runella slithyformis]